MELKHIVIVFISLTTSSEAENSYYVSSNKTIWKNAASLCNTTIATPTIQFDNDNLLFDVMYNHSEDVWIGYYRNKTMFQYIGCVAMDRLMNTTSISKNRPGYCFTACGGDHKLYIGLSQEKCFCLTEANYTLSNDCSFECSGMSGAACGSSTSMSLYKAVYGSVTPANDDIDCVRMEKTDHGIYVWWRCEDALKILCIFGNRTEIVIPSDNGQRYFQWNLALNYCFDKGGIPTSLENANSVEDNGPAWTGVLRSRVIYDYQKYDNAAESQTGEAERENYMYLDKNNKVKFDNPTKEKKVLCYKDEITTVRPVTHTATMEQGKTTQFQSPTSTAKTTQTGFTVTEKHLSDSESAGKDIGVPVGVSAAVIIIVGIPLVLIVIYKRRKVNTPKSDYTNKTIQLTENRPNDYIEIPDIKHKNGTNPKPYSELQGQDNIVHTYHVLEKDSTIEDNTNTKYKISPTTESKYNYPDMTGFVEEDVRDQLTDQGQGHYAHTYFVLEGHQKDVDSVDGTYNVTGEHKMKPDKETDNVYNTLNDKNHATYDHLRDHVSDTKSKKKVFDNIYDSKENAMIEVEPGGVSDSVYNYVPAVEDGSTYDRVKNVAL